MSIPRTLHWEGAAASGALWLLDQRLLPHTERELELRTLEEAVSAIRTLAVRGAPAIGVAAAYGAVLGLRAGAPLAEVAGALKASRPTAVNLAWAVDRVAQAVEAFRADASPTDQAARALEEARRIEAEDRAMCEAMGRHGAPLVPDRARIITHCHAGALATAGLGTALAVIHVAHRHQKKIEVFSRETRPLLQGARITCWELQRAGVRVTLIGDDMAGALMRTRGVDLVLVGADRIARNGDVANKIGTYELAVLAHAHEVPFYVVAPSSTFDLSLPSGDEIPIEERDPDEVRRFQGAASAPPDVPVWNPAFDVTPARYVRGIVTERGVVSADRAAIEALLGVPA